MTSYGLEYSDNHREYDKNAARDLAAESIIAIDECDQ